MDYLIINLCLVFLLIVILLALKRPPYQAIIVATIVAVLLYKIPWLTALSLAGQALIATDTIIVVGSFYLVTVLQRMLEQKQHIKAAEQALSDIFNSKRISASVAPSLIGLLPSIGAMPLCAAIIRSTCQDSFDKDDLACITSFYRHIPESFFPAFSNILIALTMAGISAGSFVLGMLPLVASLYIIGYLVYLRKLPKMAIKTAPVAKKRHLWIFIRSIWSIIALIIAITAFNLPVYIATPAVFILNFFIDKFKLAAIPTLLISAFEAPLLLNAVLILIFKDIIAHTGVIYALPEFFSQLPIPLPLIFALIFFFGTVISGNTAIVTICLPMALLAIPDGGLALIVFLMAISYAAMQFSPTHICLFIAADCFDSRFGIIARKNIKLLLPYMLIATVYAAIMGLFS